MAKRKGAKSGGAAQLRKEVKSKPVEESDAESEASEDMMQFNKAKKDDSDEEQDREVFNLAMDDDDDEVRPDILHGGCRLWRENEFNLIMSFARNIEYLHINSHYNDSRT